MGRIDDELREVLRDRAERVVPPADPMTGIERRARAIKRRRNAARVAASALSVLVVAVALPATVHRLQDWREDRGGSVARSSLVPGAGRAAVPAPVPAHDSRPVNYLDWPARGDTPPPSLVTDSREDFASSLRLRPTEVVTRALWAGRVSKGADWLYVFQGWPAGDREAKLAVYRARPDGESPRAIYRFPVYFQHSGLKEDPASARSNMDRVVMVAIAIDKRWALVVGAPDVSGIGYAAPDGDTFQPQSVEDGVAMVRRNAPGRVTQELFQASDNRGAILTPPDLAAERRARAGRQPVLSGWGMD
jgi:hypothetical protein